jgi:hypothetical protein
MPNIELCVYVDCRSLNYVKVLNYVELCRILECFMNYAYECFMVAC